METSVLKRRFLSSTRGRIVVLLRRESRTVNDLAGSLRLTDNAVRAHLASLERDGLVQSTGTHRGFRKPHVAYGLTAQGRRLFQQADGTLFPLLLDELAERVSSKGLEEILASVGRRAADAASPMNTATDPKARIENAVELLGEMGGLTELVEEEGRWVIRSFGCPLSDAVVKHPEACRIVEALLGQVIGLPVQNRCEYGASPQCRFEIPLAD